MALTYDQISAITEKKFLPKLYDNVFDSDPLLQRGKKKFYEKVDGGTSLIVPLNYAQTVIFGDATTNGVTAAAVTGRAFQVKVTADAEPREPLFYNFSVYAQDAARVTPYLTVVYGLRWELNPPPAERNGNQSIRVRVRERPEDDPVDDTINE